VPWVIKPLWSPLIDLWSTKRAWILVLQLVLGAALASVALTVPGPGFFRWSLAAFWLMGFSSATHDIAADGFYLLALSPGRQAGFVGVRSTFYRLAMLSGQGGLVYLAGLLQERLGGVARAWSIVFGLVAVFFAAAGAYHLTALPKPAADRSAARGSRLRGEFFAVFADFFRKRGLGTILGFLLLYRFAEAQLLKLVTPFLLDAREAGGLGLTTRDVGLLYGTLGVVALLAGGLVGGYAIARGGLRRWLWPMIVAMYAPNLVFIALAAIQPSNLTVIGASLMFEQFGYGFGFTAYMVYMMLVADGAHRTAHYAICTGFMALGMMLPGLAAGWIQEQLGYVRFFVWVCVAALPSFLATALVRSKV